VTTFISGTGLFGRWMFDKAGWCEEILSDSGGAVRLIMDFCEVAFVFTAEFLTSALPQEDMALSTLFLVSVIYWWSMPIITSGNDVYI
jgi:hypothetical protein